MMADRTTKECGCVTLGVLVGLALLFWSVRISNRTFGHKTYHQPRSLSVWKRLCINVSGLFKSALLIPGNQIFVFLKIRKLAMNLLLTIENNDRVEAKPKKLDLVLNAGKAPIATTRTVLSYLKPYELVVLAQVNHHLQSIANDEKIWEKLYCQTVDKLCDTNPSEDKNWIQTSITSGRSKKSSNINHGASLISSFSYSKLHPTMSWKLNFFVQNILKPQELLLCYAAWGRTVVCIDQDIYDLTGFAHQHPGGDSILAEYNGTDATVAFQHFAHSDSAKGMMSSFCLFSVKSHLGRKGTLQKAMCLLKTTEVHQKWLKTQRKAGGSFRIKTSRTSLLSF